MKAAILDHANASFRMTEIDKPVPRAGELLVRLVASALNPLDGKIREGAAAHAKQPLPAVLGIDGAGVVEAVGEGVAGFKAGDAVFGMIGGIGGRQGTLAEFIAAPSALFAKKPAALDMRQAAALPLVFITAWEGLVDRAKLQAGQSVLVLGGAGGVGQMAIQIARAIGCPVFATGSSARSRAAVEHLGATFIDRSEHISDVVARLAAGRGFEVVFDTAGGASLDAAFNAVARFGHVVSSLGWGSHVLAALSFKAATYSGIFTLIPLLTGEGQAHHGEIVAEAAKLADAGKLVPGLDPRRFSLADADKAFAALEEANGKIVVDIQAN
jgi:NADPH:quinone reductase-like Zn-dependent oxidoreductase